MYENAFYSKCNKDSTMENLKTLEIKKYHKKHLHLAAKIYFPYEK